MVVAKIFFQCVKNKFLCHRADGQIQHNGDCLCQTGFPGDLCGGRCNQSEALPEYGEKIIVVGSINYDITTYIMDLPTIHETLRTHRSLFGLSRPLPGCDIGCVIISVNYYLKG